MSSTISKNVYSNIDEKIELYFFFSEEIEKLKNYNRTLIMYIWCYLFFMSHCRMLHFFFLISDLSAIFLSNFSLKEIITIFNNDQKLFHMYSFKDPYEFCTVHILIHWQSVLKNKIYRACFFVCCFYCFCVLF